MFWYTPRNISFIVDFSWISADNDNHSSVLSVIILITDIEIIGLCFYFSCLLNIDNSTDSIDLLI